MCGMICENLEALENVLVCRQPAAGAAGMLSDSTEAADSPLVIEASFQRPLMEGITLSPAVVCVHDPGNTSVIAGFRLEVLC